MGSVMSAIRDDEDEWDELQKAAEVRYSEGCYSDVAGYVKTGFKDYGLKSGLLTRYVAARKEIAALKRQICEIEERIDNIIEVSKY